jgi:hypothetical protein
MLIRLLFSAKRGRKGRRQWQGSLAAADFYGAKYFIRRRRRVLPLPPPPVTKWRVFRRPPSLDLPRDSKVIFLPPARGEKCQGVRAEDEATQICERDAGKRARRHQVAFGILRRRRPPTVTENDISARKRCSGSVGIAHPAMLTGRSNHLCKSFPCLTSSFSFFFLSYPPFLSPLSPSPSLLSSSPSSSLSPSPSNHKKTLLYNRYDTSDAADVGPSVFSL